MTISTMDQQSAIVLTVTNLSMKTAKRLVAAVGHQLNVKLAAHAHVMALVRRTLMRNAYCPLIDATRRTKPCGRIGIQTTTKKIGDVVLTGSGAFAVERKKNVSRTITA